MALDLTQEDFLTPEQVGRLKEYCRGQAKSPDQDGRSNAVRNWAILHVALDTGLRVSEICDLRVGDLFLDPENPSLVVRDGKGHKKRGVRIGDVLKGHLLEFLAWKEKEGETVTYHAPLFLSSRGARPLTRTGVYRIFKSIAQKLELPPRFSIHSCRHTYASLLYRASEYNLRLVQKQLGHSSIQTTQIYADVLSEETGIAVNKLPQ
ncbi:MAG: site-specific integrase [Candidatus Bipolaricaulota bacterium]|nr:site-specific integrase [Candidatus Bipolaricaulota bacterium]